MNHKCKIMESYQEIPRTIDVRTEWGSAINFCYESDDGTLWVSNNEYGSQVNYCPQCGYEAKVKIKEKP